RPRNEAIQGRRLRGAALRAIDLQVAGRLVNLVLHRVERRDLDVSVDDLGRAVAGIQAVPRVGAEAIEGRRGHRHENGRSVAAFFARTRFRGFAQAFGSFSGAGRSARTNSTGRCRSGAAPFDYRRRAAKRRSRRNQSCNTSCSFTRTRLRPRRVTPKKAKRFLPNTVPSRALSNRAATCEAASPC